MRALLAVTTCLLAAMARNTTSLGGDGDGGGDGGGGGGGGGSGRVGEWWW